MLAVAIYYGVPRGKRWLGVDKRDLLDFSSSLLQVGAFFPRLSVFSFHLSVCTAGYKAVRRRTGNVLTRGWIVYQRDTDEINALKKLLGE